MAKEIKAKATLEGGTLPAKASLSSGIVRASADIKDVIRETVPGDYVGPDVPRRGPSDMYSAGAFVYAPAGYYPNLAAQSVDISTSLPKPAISVSNTGLITATEEITDSAFFQRGLSAERTKQLTQQRSKTVTPSDVEQTAVTAGKFTTGDVKVGAIPYTKHQIYFGFADETDVTIPVYCSDAILSEIITGYAPTTYGGKEVVLAQLDGVTWYENPVEPSVTWETVFDGQTDLLAGDPPYFWISSLSNVYPVEGERWRITFQDVEYTSIATYESRISQVCIGNPAVRDPAYDGSGCPIYLFNAGFGALMGGAAPSYEPGTYSLKLERQVSA